jgi:hypothetical protein
LGSERLTFDAATHTYRHDGFVVPSVTTVLAGVRLIDFSRANPSDLDDARDRGHAVHAAVQYDCEGVLDEATVAPGLLGYVDAARQWRLDARFDPFAVECRVYHPEYRYAGTADMVGYLDGAPVVVDWKTGRASEVAADLQLAAYVAALRAAPPAEWSMRSPFMAIQRFAIEVRANGTYKPHRYTRPMDFPLFLKALDIYHEQGKRGIRSVPA